MPVAARTSSSSRILKEATLLPGLVRTVRSRNAADEARAADDAALDRIRHETDVLLEQAQAGAEAIQAEAEHRAAVMLEEARAEGYQAGLQEGYEQGLAQAEEQNRATVARLIATAAAAEAEQERLLTETEPQLVDLALAIARKVVGAELASRPELVAEVVARAIDEARGSGHHVIRLHPSDAALVSRFLPQAAIDAGGREWEVRSDDSLEPGDCIIETAFGVVDARVETQFHEFEVLLRGDRGDTVIH